MLVGAIVCALLGFLLLVISITTPGTLPIAGLFAVVTVGLVLFGLDCRRKTTRSGAAAGATDDAVPSDRGGGDAAGRAV